MTLSIVLQQIQPLRVNWERLLQPDESVVVLCHRRDAVELPAACSQLRVVEVADFSLENLAALIRDLATEATLAPSQLRICTHDEYCLQLGGSLRQALKIPGPRRDDFVPFTDKLEMKNRLQQAGVRVPRFLPFDAAAFASRPEQYVAEVCSALGLPMIVKPVQGANNREVQLLGSSQELHQWCGAAGRTSSFQFEEYIDGALYHCNSVVRHGGIQLIQVCQYLGPCLDFSRGRPIGSITLDEENELVPRIRRLNDQVLRALRPPEPCVTHLELFRTPADELVFLEVAARAPGALVSAMCQRRTGVHLLETSLRLQMGTAGELPLAVGPHCGWAWFPCRRGTVAKLNEPDLRCACHVRWNALLGTQYPVDGDSVVCEVLFWHKDRRLVQRDADYLRQWQPTLD